MSTITSIASSDVVKNSRAVINTNFSNLNNDKVEGQSSSVDSEIALFSGTGGKTLKRASSTGILKGASGVIGVITDSSGLASAISDETGSGALVFGTSPTLSTPVIVTPTVKTWDGWNTVSDSWSYASATTITVPSGAASLYSVGDKIKLTQTTVKYFYIVAVADTLLTVTGGSDYTVASATITSPHVSHMSNPVGFPQWFNYTPTGPTNTTLTGRFTVNGRNCTCTIKGEVTGTPNFSSMPTLPITASASMLNTSGSFWSYGTGGYLDSGTANIMNTISPFVLGSGTTCVLYRNTTDSAALSSTIPITWANGDKWGVIFSYEI